MNSYEIKIRNHILSYLYNKSGKAYINKKDKDTDFDLIESGIIDSMGFVELILTVEKHFNIKIDFEDKDPSEFTTLSGFVRTAVESGGKER